MTPKYLDELAKALNFQYGFLNINNYGPAYISARAGWFKAVSAVVSVAETRNKKFDRKAFYKACGINVENYP